MRRYAYKNILILLLCCGLFFNRDRVYCIAVPVSMAILEVLTPIVSAACGALAAYALHEQGQDNKPIKLLVAPEVSKFLVNTRHKDLYTFVREQVQEKNLNHEVTAFISAVNLAILAATIASHKAYNSEYTTKTIWENLEEHVRIVRQPIESNYALELAVQYMHCITREQMAIDYLCDHNKNFKNAIEKHLWRVNTIMS